MSEERKQEAIDRRSNLDETLQGLENLDEETRGKIVEALDKSGIRTKAEVIRISNDSRKTGEDATKATLETKVEDLSTAMTSVIETLSGFKPAEATKETKSEEEKGATSVDLNKNPAFLDLIKKQQAMTEQLEGLSGDLTKTKEERTRLQALAEEKEREGLMLKAIGRQGFEDPEAVLELIKKKASFLPDPSEFPDDQVGLQVVKASNPDIPYKGENTFTSAEDFLKDFAESGLGKRFLPVDGAATASSQITGEGDAAGDTEQGAKTPSDEEFLKGAQDYFGPRKLTTA